MNNIYSILIKWHLIIIDDPKYTSGKGLLNFLEDLVKKFSFKFIVLDYIYGAYTPVLADIEKDIIEVDELLSLLPKVVQFDWGDFFLFEEYPQHWINDQNMLYPEVIKQTCSTVRIIDDQYIYIYTPKQKIVDHIKSLSKYDIESIQTDFLENLSYPE